MITTIKGTATMPLMTALQNRAFIGLIGEYWRSPASMLTAMIPQKPRASAALRSRPHFQSGRRNRRAREHRSGQRRECRERTARRRSRRSGAQRACRLRGRLDIGHSRRIECHCSCQNDKVGRDVGLEHATPSIPADAAQFPACRAHLARATWFPVGSACPRPLVLGFRRTLPPNPTTPKDPPLSSRTSSLP
jgi:hypothetical protein